MEEIRIYNSNTYLNKVVPPLSDGDLGKLFKLYSYVSSGVLIKDNKAMTKKDISDFLRIEIKATERFIKRLKDKYIMFISAEGYKINPKYCYFI